jgi:DNA-binding transcriptional MerR regulator
VDRIRPRYSLTELANLGAVTPRTIRYYISQGLLRGPATSGPGAKYDDADLARLRLIKRLQREHQPLAEIRSHLDGLGDEQILRSVEEATPVPADSALEYVRRVTTPHHVAEASLPNYSAMPPGQPSAAGAAALSAPNAPVAAPAPVASDDVRLERSQWERIDLAPDVELHVRRPLARSTAKRVDRLISIARDLLEEDPS